MIEQIDGRADWEPGCVVELVMIDIMGEADSVLLRRHAEPDWVGHGDGLETELV